MAQKSVYFLRDGKVRFLIKTERVSAVISDEIMSFFYSVFSKFPRCETVVSAVGEAVERKKLFLVKKDDEVFLKSKGVSYDGCLIRIGNDEITVSAYTDRGLLYGVYTFVENFMGVRFLHPEETIIPVRKTVKIPIGERVINPFFDMRTYLSYFTLKKEYSEFASTIRNNSNWLDLGERFGGQCQMFGRKRPNGNIDHNILEFVPVSKYKGAHPEFYIEDRNAYGDLIKPDIVNGVTEDGLLDDEMDESVVKSIISEMKKDILANPAAKYFSIEQEDGVSVVDKEKYRTLIDKYKQSGVLIRTINVIARELQAWSDRELNGREIFIVTFAYQDTSDAPVYKKNGKYYPIDRTVIPAKNVVIRLALSTDMYYGYFSKKGNSADTYEKIKSWGSICDKFMFWGYDIDFHDYFNYFPSFGVIKKNVRGFYELGTKYLLMQGAHNFKQSWQCNMRAYVYNRLFSDIELSEKKLFEEYIDGFYGKTGKVCVKEYMRRMNRHYAKILKENPSIKVCSKSEIGKAKYLDKNLLFNCIKLFDDAILKIAHSSADGREKDKYIRRLEEVLITPLWAYLNNYADFNGGSIEGRTAWAIRFFRLLNKLNVNQYNEVALVFDAVEKYEIPPLYEKFGLEAKDIIYEKD